MVIDSHKGINLKAGVTLSLRDGPVSYQLVGGVMAYQGDDG